MGIMARTSGLFFIASVTRGCSLPSSADARVSPVLLTPSLPQAVEGVLHEPSGIIQLALDQVTHRSRINRWFSICAPLLIIYCAYSPVTIKKLEK